MAFDGKGAERCSIDRHLKKPFSGRCCKAGNAWETKRKLLSEKELPPPKELEACSADAEAEWHAFAENLLNALRQAFAEKEAEIGHVKLILLDGEKSIIGNIGKLADSANCRGETELYAPHVTLILNARVQMPREKLEETVHAVVAKLAKEAEVFVGYDTELCLTPGRPNPTYHYNQVI